MLLIYSNENDGEDPEMMKGYAEFTQHVMSTGVMRGADRLHRTEDARTVRVRNGATTVTDGPFAETKEQLGGYYMVECGSADEAIALAARTPNAKNGSVEVRPIWEMNGDGA